MNLTDLINRRTSVEKPELEALAADGRFAALEALLLPVDAGLAHFTAIALDEDAIRRVGQGQAVPVAAVAATDPVNIVGPDGRSRGLGSLGEDGLLRPRRLFRTHGTCPG